MFKRNPAIDVFLDKAITYDGDDCLIWPFGLLPDGYASLNRFIKHYGTRVVSKVICIEVYGHPPTVKHEAAHSKKCISRACINRKHLRWATSKENKADDHRGEDHHKAKLTEEQVFEILKLGKEDIVTQIQIANKFEISRPHVNQIINRRRWQWLEEPSDAELIWETTRPRMKDLFA